MRPLLLALALAGASFAAQASSPDAIEVGVAFDGTGKVGEPIEVRLTWRVSPNVPSTTVRVEAPEWVRIDGPTSWALESARDTVQETKATLTLTPTRDGYWRLGGFGDGFGARTLLAARSLAQDGQLAREPSVIVPDRPAAVAAELGATNATHAEIIVSAAKGAGWSPLERLVLGAAGHGRVVRAEGDAGVHREWLEVPEGHALSLQAVAIIEVDIEGPAVSDGSHRQTREARAMCYTVGRTGGNVTFEGGECRYSVAAPGAAAALLVTLCFAAALRRRA